MKGEAVSAAPLDKIGYDLHFLFIKLCRLGVPYFAMLPRKYYPHYCHELRTNIRIPLSAEPSEAYTPQERCDCISNHPFNLSIWSRGVYN